MRHRILSFPVERLDVLSDHQRIGSETAMKTKELILARQTDR